MKRVIENGVTILSVGDLDGRKKNDYGHTGVTFNKRVNKYRAELCHDGIKYHLGYSESLDEVIEFRKQAEQKADEGTFVEWFNERRKNGKGNNK